MATRTWLVTVLAVAGSACTAPAGDAMPWLYGFSPAASATDEDPTGLAVRAPTRDGGATDLVVASLRGGVVVIDAAGSAIARAPGIDRDRQPASADEVDALAVGDAQIGAPVIAIARTLGGHRESTTSLALYQPAPDGTLALLFDEPVETRVGTERTRGFVLALPRALIYRNPTGPISLWSFDDGAHRYVLRIELAPPPQPRESEPAPPPPVGV